MGKKIALDAETFAVPLNKLVLSPKNVRKTYAAEEIEEMAASIAAKNRGLLQNLGVIEQLDGAGEPTGLWEVVAGGRRYRALKLLAERKRLSATAPIPCRRVASGEALDASLAENEHRRALHPADAYEAFAALHDGGKGLGVEEIAARFGVSAHAVRQRLRLGAVAPALLAAYREGRLTLDHVMAFAVTEDRAAQERVYAELPDWQRTPAAIRRALTKAHVPADDPRVLLVGLDAYRAAGGSVQRDLFSDDGGGWVADAVLLERLVGERVREAADQVRAEGWKWVATDPQDIGACWRFRRVWPEEAPLPEADAARRDALCERLDELAAEHPDGPGGAPEAVRAEWEASEAELDALEARGCAFRPEDVARAGAVVVLTGAGTLRIERGYVRPEDEPRPSDPPPDGSGVEGTAAAGLPEDENGAGRSDAEEDVDGGNGPSTGRGPGGAAVMEPKAPVLPADLEAELSAHRTMALRAEIAHQPDLGLRVLAHSLATGAFYGAHNPTVARLAYAYGLAGGVPADSPARQAVMAAEDEQRAKLPPDHAGLWAWLEAQDTPALHALVAVCVARVTEAGGGDWTGEAAGASFHVAALAARRAGLDMRRWWSATRPSYLGRVTKAGILAAVREGAGEDAARRIEGMKKEAMAENAEALLTGTGWLPARLRVPGERPAVPGHAEAVGRTEGAEVQEAVAAE